mgnify:CR=1 FL=1
MEPHNLIVVSKQFAWVYLRLQRLIDRNLSRHDASLAKIRLLAFLDDGPKRSTDIASFFGQAPRTVMMAQAQPLYEAILSRTMGALSGDELQLFSDLLTKVEAAVERIEAPAE